MLPQAHLQNVARNLQAFKWSKAPNFHESYIYRQMLMSWLPCGSQPIHCTKTDYLEKLKCSSS